MRVRKSLSGLVLAAVCAAGSLGCNKPADSGAAAPPAGGAAPAVEEVKGAPSGSAAAPAE